MEKKKLYINGEWVEAISQNTITVENPATREILGVVPAAGVEDIEKAVQGATDAFPAWKEMKPKDRVKILKKANEILKEEAEELADIIYRELGCPKDFALKTQTLPYLKDVEQMLDYAKKFEYEVDDDGYKLLYEPMGVVACMTPWNYPLGQVTKKIFPALAAGNTVILKPSSQTPLVAYKIVEAFDEAGLPAGVLQLVPGSGGEVGNELSAHPLVDMVTFTGSTKGGQEVAKTAAEGIKKQLLELGGKSPALVLEGADLDVAAKKVLNTVVYNTGQTCSALTRLIAPLSEKKNVEKALLDRIKTYEVGDPTKKVNAGPLQSQKQFDKVKSFIERGLEEKATLLYGSIPEKNDSYYVKPVIFTDVKNDMEIAKEEIFGPVLSVIYYEGEEEGLRLANETKYGLSSAVFGPEEKAVEMAKKIRAGNCFVNDGKSPTGAPFGGYKHSGFGREGGKFGFREFLQTKAVFDQA